MEEDAPYPVEIEFLTAVWCGSPLDESLGPVAPFAVQHLPRFVGVWVFGGHGFALFGLAGFGD